MLQELGLNIDMLIVLSILLGAIILFISNIIRVDVVAMLVLVALGFSRLLPTERLFSGFSSDAVISSIAIMIISYGLENTGISLLMAKWMLKIGREHPKRILFLLMTVSGLLASFMRSLGTAALFLPIVTRINARTGINKRFLLLPMAFTSILGGNLTMVGTGSLIILNSLLKNSSQLVKPSHEHLFAPFKLFYILPIGVFLLISGMLYLILISRKFALPIKTEHYSSGAAKEHFIKTYGKGGNIFELRLPPESSLVNCSLRDLEAILPETISVLAVLQNGEYHFPPLRKIILKSGSVIGVMGGKEEIKNFAEQKNLHLSSKLNVFTELLHPIRAGLCEVVIPPYSQLIGQEVRELHMRRNHKLHVLGLYRGNKIYNGEELNALTLRSGDTLGIFSRWDMLAEFSKHPDFFVLTNSYPHDKTYPKKMPYALFFLALSIFLVVIGNFPISVGLLLGAAGMIITRVINIDQAYHTVSWKTIFLLAGLIPLGLVIQSTGTAEWLLTQIHIATWGLNNWWILAILSVITTIFALVISNIGATILLVPIAIDLALSLGGDPRLFALTVAIAASNTFIVPTNQVNALIAGPGNYTMKDFILVGTGMTFIFWIVTLVGLYLFYQ